MVDFIYILHIVYGYFFIFYIFNLYTSVLYNNDKKNHSSLKMIYSFKKNPLSLFFKACFKMLSFSPTHFIF